LGAVLPRPERACVIGRGFGGVYGRVRACTGVYGRVRACREVSLQGRGCFWRVETGVLGGIGGPRFCGGLVWWSGLVG